MRDTTHGGKDWTALTYVRQPTATSRYVGDTARCHSPLTVSPWLARVWHGRCSYGTGLGLVSVKLARTFPSATIVSVKRHRADVEPQQALLKLLGIRNCLIAASQLSRDNLRALAAAEDPARFQVIGVDVFEELLSSAASLWYVNRHGWMSASAQGKVSHTAVGRYLVPQAVRGVLGPVAVAGIVHVLGGTVMVCVDTSTTVVERCPALRSSHGFPPFGWPYA